MFLEICAKVSNKCSITRYLKEYYEIVDEARPVSGLFPTYADFVYRNAFLIMKVSKLPSFRVIAHKFCSVLTCDILGISLL